MRMVGSRLFRSALNSAKPTPPSFPHGTHNGSAWGRQKGLAKKGDQQRLPPKFRGSETEPKRLSRNPHAGLKPSPRPDPMTLLCKHQVGQHAHGAGGFQHLQRFLQLLALGQGVHQRALEDAILRAEVGFRRGGRGGAIGVCQPGATTKKVGAGRSNFFTGVRG